ncbi:sensor histidine kinase [uncultured Amnibacterium sp.]|uniref:sensor histidine kinase n=1 Tax=uncultured Amnibacterium sp. TaxID=1631851 RepID=UPI0035C944B5
MTDTRGRDMAARMGLAPIGSRRIEMVLAGMVSLFGLLFAAMTLPRLAEDWAQMSMAVGLLLAVSVYGTIAVAALSALLHQWTRSVFGGTALVYLAALALWPVAVGNHYDGPGAPWLFAIAGVPCALMIVAARWFVATGYVFSVTVAIAAIRTTPPGGSATLSTALLGASSTAELGLALLLVVHAVRRAARDVDSAEGAALSLYAGARIDEATESERTRTDSLVHDSVLTTFLSAAGAHTPEARALASRMAVHTMTVLSRATVASHIGPKVPIAELPARVRSDSAGIGDAFTVATENMRDQSVPESVADAIVSAAVQAMTNSVKHAGGPEVPRSITFEGIAGGGIRVVVEDRGRGFDPSAVASERLGLRVSIIERMHRVGGDVEVRTAIGEGATFVLSWPASAVGAADRAAAGDSAVLA